MNYKKSSLYQLIVLGLLFAVAFSCGKETPDSDLSIRYEKNLYADTLFGYDVTTFEEHSNYYQGVAYNCDGYGGCDSINFISNEKPKLGPAKFLFYSAGYECGWGLVTQNK